LTDPGSGAISAERAVKSSVELFRLWEPHIRAFAWTDPTVALECAQAADRDPVPIHHQVLAAEAHRNVFPLASEQMDLCSPEIVSLLSAAAAVSELEYEHAFASEGRLLSNLTAGLDGSTPC